MEKSCFDNQTAPQIAVELFFLCDKDLYFLKKFNRLLRRSFFTPRDDRKKAGTKAGNVRQKN